ncbi:DUF6115 domain-containing protein [Allobacillus sp. GCM10007491]|uniref:Swarming motility protein SwrB n=2 Tax=Allobacillus TaxID=1400133 RepID=A0A941CUR1_9BACI|nr:MULTISPECIES: hypothetical protein [Allobacillus]MBR7552916.1 hypothetical protein [Allobacillus saliphilus]TSJ67177.1 hypothetical protein FPQ13_02670 [Allobacillus salarius]
MLLLSLILHGVTFIFLFLLYQKLQERKDREKIIEQKEKEIDGLFHDYLVEIKAENQKFTEQLNKLKIQQDEKMKQQQSKESAVEEGSTGFEEEPFFTEENFPEELDYEPLIPEEDEEPVYEVTLESRVLHLYDQGYSADQIAKQLNVGVTEIELMIKIHKQLSN